MAYLYIIGAMVAIGFAWFLVVRKDQKASALAKVTSDQAKENSDKLGHINESNLAINKQTDNAIDRLGVRPPD